MNIWLRLTRLNETERVKKELAQNEYSDPSIGEAEREKGILVQYLDNASYTNILLCL